MVKVILSNSVIGRIERMAPASKNIREFLEENEFDIQLGQLNMGGRFLTREDLDCTFEELGIEDATYFSNVLKHDNAATIKVVGDACVVESAYSAADIEKLAKYRPTALQLTDDKGNVKFAVAVACEGHGAINANGAEFAYSEDGNATITKVIPGCVADKAAYVEDKIGVSILKLNQVEAKFADALAEVANEQAAVRAAIQVL